MLQVAKILASGLGSGYTPLAPGTAGALVATLGLGAFLHLQGPISPLGMALLIGLTYLLGWWSTNAVHKVWPHDDNKIVIDEILGIFVSLFLVPLSPMTLVMAFVLFRIFDIWKPLGIRYFDRKSSAHSVLLDDLLAGVYTNLVLQLLIYLDIVPSI